MTIKKVSHVTEITPGQWICMSPILMDHICTGPREVIRRSGKRVYFRNRRGEDDGQYCAISSVIALCDTRREADAVFAVSQCQADELNAVRKRHAAQFEMMFGAHISGGNGE